MNMVQEFALNLITLVVLVVAFLYGLYQLTLPEQEGDDDGIKFPEAKRHKASK
tara:strand:- start:2406 stop:2564 length:159 start_codon:yes stop_codon:yes gene_type:complete